MPVRKRARRGLGGLQQDLQKNLQQRGTLGGTVPRGPGMIEGMGLGLPTPTPVSQGTPLPNRGIIDLSGMTAPQATRGLPGSTGRALPDTTLPPAVHPQAGLPAPTQPIPVDPASAVSGLPAPTTEKEGGGFLPEGLSDYLTTFGLNLMATKRPDFLGAVGEAGLAAQKSKRGVDAAKAEAKLAERRVTADEKRAEAYSSQVEYQVQKFQTDEEFRTNSIKKFETDENGILMGLTSFGVTIPIKHEDGTPFEKMPDWLIKKGIAAMEQVFSPEEKEEAWKAALAPWRADKARKRAKKAKKAGTFIGRNEAGRLTF